MRFFDKWFSSEVKFNILVEEAQLDCRADTAAKRLEDTRVLYKRLQA